VSVVLTTATIISKQRPLLLRLNLPSLILELPLAESVLPIFALNHTLPSILNNSIQPRRKSEPRLRNLLCNNRNRSLIVLPTNLLVSHSIRAFRYNCAAHKRIRIIRPQHRGINWFLRLEALAPSLALLLIHPALNLARQISRPALRISKAEIPRKFLRNRRIPRSMQICPGAVECDVNQVAADFEVLDVQRLVDVADEVDHPLERLLLLGQADGRGDSAGGVVGDGGYDAAFFGAVALVVDVAGCGG
jgi:hypothetical protein